MDAEPLKGRFVASVRTVAMIAALFAATSTTSSQSRDQTFLAVVRQDGSLIPIAVHYGAEWWNRWPWATESDDEVASLPIPPNLAAIPKDWLPPGMSLPSRWTLLTGSGRRVPIRATQPVKPPDFDLMATIGVRTDYRGHTNGEWSDEIGVAIAGAGELGSFRRPARAEHERILRQLAYRLGVIERTEIARWLHERDAQVEGERITLSPRKRTGDDKADAGPFQLVMPSRPLKGLNYSYLTGAKLFNMGLKDGDCQMNLSVSGIVVTRPNGDIVSEDISAEAYAEYCGDAGGWMTPLATLLLNGRLLWIVKHSVEDGYHYGLLDPTGVQDITLKGSWQLRSNQRTP